MAGNEIHLDKFNIGGAITKLEDLEKRVAKFHKQKTYGEILSEAREGLKKISSREMSLDEYKTYIEGELQRIHKNDSRNLDEEETYWERRLKRLKARLKAEQELFEHEMPLQKTYELEMAEVVQKAKDGSPDSLLPEKPIIGVPARFLLNMLDGN